MHYRSRSKITGPYRLKRRFAIKIAITEAFPMENKYLVESSEIQNPLSLSASAQLLLTKYPEKTE